jgi:hypothetical protein
MSSPQHQQQQQRISCFTEIKISGTPMKQIEILFTKMMKKMSEKNFYA